MRNSWFFNGFSYLFMSFLCFSAVSHGFSSVWHRFQCFLNGFHAMFAAAQGFEAGPRRSSGLQRLGRDATDAFAQRLEVEKPLESLEPLLRAPGKAIRGLSMALKHPLGPIGSDFLDIFIGHLTLDHLFSQPLPGAWAQAPLVAPVDISGLN